MLWDIDLIRLSFDDFLNVLVVSIPQLLLSNMLVLSYWYSVVRERRRSSFGGGCSIYSDICKADDGSKFCSSCSCSNPMSSHPCTNLRKGQIPDYSLPSLNVSSSALFSSIFSALQILVKSIEEPYSYYVVSEPHAYSSSRSDISLINYM